MTVGLQSGYSIPTTVNQTNWTSTYTNLNVVNLTTGYLPYKSSTTLGNSPIYTDGTNVGIGIVPSYKLDVNGDINIADGSYYKYGGQNALKLAKGTDTYYANTFVGLGAGNSSASRQTAIGYSAGHSNTKTNQTAIGSWAGYLNTGAYQTAIGQSSGQSNSGAYQTAIGQSAGSSNTGTSQTAIGYYAGSSNTGTSQTAIGYYAGSSNTGNQVTGLGYQATNNNSGDNVVAIGYQAGYNNTVANQFIVKQANINAVPLIQGDFASGNVGIGTTSPNQKLTLSSGSNYATEMTTPTGVTATLGATGTLSGTYYYKVSAYDGVGWTNVSSEVSGTVDGGTTNGTITVAWTAVTGATNYRVWRGTVAGTETEYYAITAVSLADDGSLTFTAGTPPTSTSAYVNKISSNGDSWFLGGSINIADGSYYKYGGQNALRLEIGRAHV